MIYSLCRSLRNYPKSFRTIFALTHSIGYNCKQYFENWTESDGGTGNQKGHRFGLIVGPKYVIEMVKNGQNRSKLVKIGDSTV